MRKKSLLRNWIFYLIVLIMGCTERQSMNESEDANELRKLVKLDLPIKTVRWEVFGTPEYSGGVPGPTDYVTLLAEITPAMPITAANIVSAETKWMVPNSMRSWLSDGSKAFVSQYSKGETDFFALQQCAPFEAKLVKTNEIAKGFICNNSHVSLVYLTLFDSLE